MGAKSTEPDFLYKFIGGGASRKWGITFFYFLHLKRSIYHFLVAIIKQTALLLFFDIFLPVTHMKVVRKLSENLVF